MSFFSKFLPCYIVVLLNAFCCSDPSVNSGNPPTEEKSPKQLSILKGHSYWSVGDTSTWLAAAGLEDNLFQSHPIAPQLNALTQSGSNFIRCTLSSRDVANQFPYQQMGDARYDLNVWSENYWNRIDKFLQVTAERNIVVQLEIWALLDFYKPLNAWAKNPFNPMNNLNYTEEESGLPSQINYPPLEGDHPFFTSIPAVDNNVIILYYQHRFVQKVLDVLMPHTHVLLCVNSGGDIMSEWNRYWAEFIRGESKKRKRQFWVGTKVNTLNLRNKNLSLSDTAWLSASFSALESFVESSGQLFDFLDYNEHNFLRGELHYQQAMRISNLLKYQKEGIFWHTTAIYGGQLNEAWSGTIDDAPERFWQNIVAGAAAVRFETTPVGLGTSNLARAHLKSLSVLNAFVGLGEWQSLTGSLLKRETAEAFTAKDSRGNIVCYFPSCASVQVKMPEENGKVKVSWLELLKAGWAESQEVDYEDGQLSISSPCEGKWVAVITATQKTFN